MIKLIIGKKGSGKTKKLADMVNAAAETSLGNVVCIDRTDHGDYHCEREGILSSFSLAGSDP